MTDAWPRDHRLRDGEADGDHERREETADRPDGDELRQQDPASRRWGTKSLRDRCVAVLGGRGGRAEDRDEDRRHEAGRDDDGLAQLRRGGHPLLPASPSAAATMTPTSAISAAP